MEIHDWDAEQRIDMDLMCRIQKGDQEAFTGLYNRYAPRVLGLTRRVISDARESEDLVQIVFLCVWRKCRAYRPERGTVQAYIFQIAKSRMIDEMRKHQREATEMSSSSSLEDHAQRDNPIDLLDASLTAAALLENLNPDERRAVELAVYGGFSQREISQVLRRPLGTVKSWVRRGLQKVRKSLEDSADNRREGEQ